MSYKCHYHFNRLQPGNWDEIDKESEGCWECQHATIEVKAKMQWQDTIDPFQPIGQHIPLTCKNHPDKFWTTKNLYYIGARSIFYHSPLGEECSCPVSDLVPVGR